MRAAVLKAGGGFEIRDLPIPEPGFDECLIEVSSCGVCTSDMGAWKNGLGHEEVLGHEVIGRIAKTGADVTEFEIGQIVTGCIMQGYAEYTVAKAEKLILLSDDTQDKDAIFEPFVCLLSGVDRLAPTAQDKIAVVGAGYMGLALMQILKCRGITNITAIDKAESALKNVSDITGCKAVYPEDVAGEVFDIVFEVGGSQSSLDLASSLCRQYGILGILGYHPCVRTVDMQLWAGKALTAVNIFEYRQNKQLDYMKEALLYETQGKLSSGKLITHSFSFEDITQAFTTHCNKPEGYIKGIVKLK